MVRGKICCIIVVALLLIGAIGFPPLGRAVNVRTKKYKDSPIEIVPIPLNNKQIGKDEKNFVKSSFKDVTFRKGTIEIYSGNNIPYYLGPSISPEENNFKVHVDDWVVPISKSLSKCGGVTSPPWYDCGHGTEVIEWFLAPFHSESSSVNCNTGKGNLKLDASCGWSMVIRTHAWGWFKGYFDCMQSGDYGISFKIDYEGLAQAIDVPIDVGIAVLNIEANVGYKFGDFEIGSYLIYSRAIWPQDGNYPIPGPYQPDGPYTIGYPTKKYLQEGYRYFFVVQFNVWLYCAATFFTVSAGKIDLNIELKEAIISAPPPTRDFVSQGTVKINNDVYLAIYPEPLYFKPGSTVKIHAFVWNEGVESGSCYVAIGVDNTGYEGGPFNIPAGGINSAVHLVLNNFKWPNDLSRHYIWCFADCRNNVPESNEDNNIGVIEWAAVGPPYIKISAITLIKYNEGNWPPDANSINWNNPDQFYAGDRVVPLAKVINTGTGPSLNLTVKYYWDGTLKAQGGPFAIGADDWVVFTIKDSQSNLPGFVWPDDQGHEIKWVIEDVDYGQSDTKKQTYYPQQTSQPKIELTPSSYDYGNLRPGEYKDYTFKLKNIGNAKATGSVYISGDQSFSITNSVTNFNLDPNAFIDVIVRFNPSSQGSKSAILVAKGDSPCNEARASLSGSCGSGGGKLRVSPDSLYFELAPEESKSQDITIENIGNNNVTFTVTKSANWIININPRSGLLQPGENVHVKITVLAPNTPNSDYRDSLVVRGENEEVTVSVNLHVYGPKLKVSPTSLHFVKLSPGETASADLTIKNEGIGTLEWRAVDNANWITDINPSSGSLSSGKSQKVTVTVTAPNKWNGEWKGTVSITSNGGDQDISVALSTIKLRNRTLLFDILKNLAKYSLL